MPPVQDGGLVVAAKKKRGDINSQTLSQNYFETFFIYPVEMHLQFLFHSYFSLGDGF